MNAIHDLTKPSENPADPRSDVSPEPGTSNVDAVVRTQKMQAADAALPDPITGIYGALRGLIDQGNTGIVVHVVAATQEEGASTIARSIAATAARTGSGRVLLLDGKLPAHTAIDERRPARGDQMTAMGGHKPPPNSAHGETTVDGLFIGRIADAAHNERVNPRDVKDAYAAWRKEYDLVIVDCPAVATGRYIDLVPGAADWVVLVVQAEKLRPVVLRKVRETIEQQGGKILGVILKDTKRYIPEFIYRLI